MKIEIIKGDDTILHVVFTDENNSVIDITGASVTFTVKKSVEGVAIIQKTVTTHTNPTNGETDVSLDNQDTDIDAGLYYYDLQITFANGKINSVDYGELFIKQDITN